MNDVPRPDDRQEEPSARAPTAASGEPLLGSYFVATYPPFFHWSPETVAAAEAALDTPPGQPAPPLGLYVHVPFCVQRCRYCHYLSYDDRAQDMEPYLGAVLRELSALVARPALEGRWLDFVYFGGGTPSVLSASHVGQLLDWLRRTAPWKDHAEITFECAPRTVTQRKAEVLRTGGVTRVSLGVQQLDDGVLRASGRIHLVEDVEHAYGVLRAAGFDVINLDLMVGLPGETDSTFMSSLERLVELSPDSITIYQTEAPPNTPLYRSVCQGVQGDSPAPWREKRKRLSRGFARLEAAGYVRRSAYAAVREAGKAPFVYQDALYQGADMLGIGVSAFSYLGGIHHQNLAEMDAYLDAVHAGRLPLMRAHALTPLERAVREFVLQLKLGRVDLKALGERHGVDLAARFLPTLARHAQRGYLSFDESEVVVTPRGLLSVDRWLRSYFLEEHQGPWLA